MSSKPLNLSNKKHHTKEPKEGKMTLSQRLKTVFSSGNDSLPENKPKRKKEDVTDSVFKTLSSSSTSKAPVKQKKKQGSQLFKTPPPRPREVPKEVDEDIGIEEVETNKVETPPPKQVVDDKLMDKIERGEVIPPKPVPEKSKARKRQFTYLEPIDHSREKREVQQPLVEIKAERVIAKRPVMETVSDINSIKLMDRISLVTYYNDKKSGRLDEREALRLHKENTEMMERYYSLVYFIQEASIRALELRGEYEYTLQIDSKDRDILDEVIADSNLSSYEIEIFYENRILSRLAVEPVFLKIRLREV